MQAQILMLQSNEPKILAHQIRPLPDFLGGFNAGSLDLLIAALSIHHDAELITFDADYLAIARVSKLRVHHLSRNVP